MNSDPAADPATDPPADPAARPDAILLTGVLGSGKTTVATAVGDELDRAGIAYAVIDLDWLCWVGPDLAGAELDDLLAQALAAVATVYRNRGIRRFVLARTITTAQQRDALRQALGPDATLAVIALAVPPGVAADRLRARGPLTASPYAAERDLAQRDLAEQAALAAATTLVPDATVPNSGRSVRTTALDVLAAAGWTRAPR